MTPEELEDEVISINSIYGESTLESTSDENVFALALPSLPAISLRLDFPTNYPDAPPSVLGTQSVGEHIAKGQGQQLVDLVRALLAEVYIPGAPCIFDLIETAGEKLQQLGMDAETRQQEQQAAEANGTQQHHHGSDGLDSADVWQQSPDELGDEPPWTLSEPVTEKKSVFIARAAEVHSVQQARQFLAHLLATDRKVARATHNITAWRIKRDDGIQFQDCDDDGETAAGGRVLHLLELMDVWNVMVVVTRWYGGVLLGPDRFRIINSVARDSVLRGGFAEETGGKGGPSKKKGRK